MMNVEGLWLDTVLVNEFILTMLFSTIRFPRPSLEIEVTKGPAVVQAETKSRGRSAMRRFIGRATRGYKSRVCEG